MTVGQISQTHTVIWPVIFRRRKDTNTDETMDETRVREEGTTKCSLMHREVYGRAGRIQAAN